MRNKISNFKRIIANILIIISFIILSNKIIGTESDKYAFSLAQDNNIRSDNSESINDTEQNLFTIKNIVSFGEYGNTGDSKTAAYVSARAQAFKDLLIRIVPKNQLNKILTPNDQEISKMVRDQTITWDRTTSRSYRAIFDIQFNHELVKAWLNNQGIRYASQYSARSLIIPILHQNGQYYIWSNKDWYNAWDIANSNFGLLQLQTLQGKLIEIGIVDPQNIMVTQFSTLEPLLKEINATEASIVFVEVQENNAEATVRIVNKNSEIIKHCNYTVYPKDKKQDLWQNIAADMIGKIDMLWKGSDTFSDDKTFISDVYIIPTSNSYWKEMEKTLRDIPFIKNIEALPLSNFQNNRSQIKVAITYAVPPVVMSSYLKKYGIIVYKQDNKTYMRME
mgnify:CR=1 FL=1